MRKRLLTRVTAGAFGYPDDHDVSALIAKRRLADGVCPDRRILICLRKHERRGSLIATASEDTRMPLKQRDFSRHDYQPVP